MTHLTQPQRLVLATVHKMNKRESVEFLKKQNKTIQYESWPEDSLTPSHCIYTFTGVWDELRTLNMVGNLPITEVHSQPPKKFSQK